MKSRKTAVFHEKESVLSSSKRTSSDIRYRNN